MKRPSLFTKEKIALFLAEIVVVVVGILIAFQVEEWRDRLAERREVDAALTRLMEETEIKYFIEAALLASGRPVSVEQLHGLFDGR